MYAIIKTGGKQYRVKENDIIDVELLKAEEGSEIAFKPLFIHDGSNAHVGLPEVDGFAVKGVVVGSSVGPKIVSMKYQPRENQRTRWGHRQHYSRIKITSLGAEQEESKKKPAKQESAEPKAVAPKTRAPKSAESKQPSKRAKKATQPKEKE